MTKEKLTYKEAMLELEQLMTLLEDNKLDIDDLSNKVKRISQLIQFCKAKLKETESEVENILKDLK